MADAAITQVAYTTILRHFVDHGRAPHYTELATTFGLSVEAARELLHDTAARISALGAGWLVPDMDLIAVWSPFSNVATHCTITVDGEQRWFAQ